ncbi:hypothetical protein [Hymenobacter wooponensis]|uniref:Uncharacterized protein n=1 Tax=Hymenobacter wooponensis TaxID=1525360 RepID=A0A4Z0MG08_9BACT|nr:hypothetical protein [Hymenobacter wooponensis]TGD78228.1 hypothetical protein EU557_19135 [Hymenobacter wooponensis]
MNKFNIEIENLIKKMNSIEFNNSSAITLACPVPYFGNIHNAKIATVGINPSNLEFLDNNNIELGRWNRRFPTLTSLGLSSWANANERHFDLIEESCTNYFKSNPYDMWFKKLDHIISGSNYSYYFPLENACHLDLIPYATKQKWSELSNAQRNYLIHISGDIIRSMINKSSVTHLILNGKTVINLFSQMFNIELTELPMVNWSLPRKTTDNVKGISYVGILRTTNKDLTNRDIIVLGYNHNIQSSFGVTSQVQKEIRNWVSHNVITGYEAERQVAC